jgi:sRNA-binding protein
VLTDVLRMHTRAPGYLAHLAAGENRRHLDGTEAGTPTPDQQAYARVGLERLLKKCKAPEAMTAAGDVVEAVIAQVKVKP